MSEDKPAIVTCSGCEERYTLTLGVLSERPVKGHEADRLTEVGLVCPHCQLWQHAWLKGPDLNQAQVSLDRALALWQKQRNDRNLKNYQRAKRRFNRAFDEFQAMWRPVLGLESPAAVTPKTERRKT